MRHGRDQTCVIRVERAPGTLVAETVCEQVPTGQAVCASLHGKWMSSLMTSI